jgi:hypothetical protein
MGAGHADRLGLVGGVVVHQEVNVEIGGHGGLDLVEEPGDCPKFRV